MASNYNMYFGSKPVYDWTPNGSKESGHNFTEQIGDQEGVISNKQNEYDTQTGQVGNAQTQYDDAYKGMEGYSDIYRRTKGEEGVDDAKAQYQKSLASVNATQSAMNNLPSSINAGSNVVLNASQRNAALGNQMSKFQNTLDYQTRQNAGDRDMYQTAIAAAQNSANQTASLQRQDAQIALSNLQTQMEYANKLYNQLINERQIMRQIYGDMYEDEYRHMQQELEAWAQNLQAETARYAQDQETARNNAKIAAEERIANADREWQKYMADKEEQQRADYNNAQGRAAFQDNLNKYYAQYQAQLDDLDRESDDFGSYLFGRNSLFSGNGITGNLTWQQAKRLRNKGFEGYLQEQAPYLQKELREKYQDLLGYYGIGG